MTTIPKGLYDWIRGTPGKVVLALMVGMAIPIASTAAGDMVWLHFHRLEADPLVEQYKVEHPQLKRDIASLHDEVGNLVKEIKELTSEIRQEREERIKEARGR